MKPSGITVGRRRFYFFRSSIRQYRRYRREARRDHRTAALGLLATLAVGKRARQANAAFEAMGDRSVIGLATRVLRLGVGVG